MEFEKVRKEHILKAIKDYQEKGLPKGFGPSSTYDMYYKDESYPPKAIMANFDTSKSAALKKKSKSTILSCSTVMLRSRVL